MLKVRWVAQQRVQEKTIPADRVTLLGSVVVFSRTTTPPSENETILLMIPESRLVDAEEASVDEETVTVRSWGGDDVNA